MKAVISADIILEPRNTVIYYSPLIKASISLSVPLLSSLPLKASPPPSPSFTHLSLHTLSHPLVNFLHDPSYMPLFFLFLPFFAPLLSPSPLLLPPHLLIFPFYLLPLTVSPVWFNKRAAWYWCWPSAFGSLGRLRVMLATLLNNKISTAREVPAGLRVIIIIIQARHRGVRNCIY